MQSNNLTGLSFGKLVVIGRDLAATKGHGNYVKWICKCECGTVKSIQSNNLIHGFTRSCGCWRKELFAVAIAANAIPFKAAALKKYVSVYKHNAKNRNLEFTLTDTKAYQLAESNCSYCNMPPSRLINLKQRKIAPVGIVLVTGIDRKDNDTGYTDDNCVPCCTICNQAKHTLPYDVWMSWLQRLVEFRK